MKDIKYIIKRILIGIGIATALMFIRQNVYAYEWTTEGDTQLSTVGYGMANNIFYMNYSRRDSAGNYPLTINGSSVSYGFYQTDESGTGTGTVSNLNRIYGPTYITGLKLSLANYPFTTGNNYYAIFAFGYDTDGLTSISNNFNEELILESSTYTALNSSATVNEDVVIDSVGFVFGSTNEIENNSSWPYIYYYKVNFHVLNDTDEVYFLINSSQTQNITYTAYNTSTFTNYLTKFNFSCTSYNTTVSSCSRYYTRYYKPFIYTHEAGSIYPDPSITLDDVTEDIKTQIGNIINGQFTEDLTFGDVNIGGTKYGDNNYTLQDIILFPLEFLKAIVDNHAVCVGPTLPLPGSLSSYNFTLPCASTFFSSIFPTNFIDLIKNLFGVVIGWFIVINLYNDVNTIIDPTELKKVDAWFF